MKERKAHKRAHNEQAGQIPVLGMEWFQPGGPPGAEPGSQQECRLQYHEIRGARRIGKPHRHDFFLFLLFHRGSGTHTIDFTEYKVGPRQLHLLFPHQVHEWTLGKDTLAFQLMISTHRFEQFADALGISFMHHQDQQVMELSQEAYDQVRAEFRNVQRELQQQPVHWRIIDLRTQLIAEQVNREAERNFDALALYRGNPQLLRFQSLVDEQFREQRSVAYYARQLHISANYLNILCRRHLGRNALSVLQKRQLLEAKRLVRTTDRSFKEIAFELGFSDPAHFSNFFRKQTGLSPAAFRSPL